MPVYNEEKVIGNVLDNWLTTTELLKDKQIYFLVINDGSTDNTTQILKDLSEKHENLIVINKENTGHGQSCLFGYKKSLELGADYIFQTDSDGQTNPDDFVRYYKLIEEHPFVLGFRKKRKDNFFRKIISKLLQVLILLITGVYIKDANMPFRFFRRDFLEKLIINFPSGNVFLVNVFLSIKATKILQNYPTVEVSFRERPGGKSSLNVFKIMKVGLQFIYQIIRYRHYIVEFEPYSLRQIERQL